MANIIDSAKNVVSGFRKFIKRIGRFIKFVCSKVGFVISCIILVVILSIILALLFRTVEHAFGMLFNPDYAGISTDYDYKYISSSISNANYDSLISDKNYQEYMAYEYAMLMDVAEFLYKGQNELDYSKSENAGHYKTVKKSGDEILEDRKSPDYMPYLKVQAEYNLDKMTHKQWQYAIIAGQISERYGLQSIKELADAKGANGEALATADEIKGLTTGHDVYGGNKNVVPPILTYEFHTNQYDSDKGSLVPYITVIKEDREYDYYTVRGVGENGGRNKYDPNKGGAYAQNPVNKDGVIIDESNIDDINLMTTYKDYNVHNYYLGSAPDTNEAPSGPGYKNSSANSQKGSTIDAKDNWPTSDNDPKNSLFYTGFAQKQTYKIPLQTLIDRYLPKAALLASWHFAKDNDYADKEITTGHGEIDAKSKLLASSEGIFDVTELIKDIKEIYNYYCLNGEIKNNGKTLTINDSALQSESVPSLTYDAYGSVVRNESGEAVEGGQATRHYENDKSGNNITFLRFGQAGLETNRFGIYKFYVPGETVAGGPQGDKDVTHAEDDATVPIISDLISRSGEFLDTMHFHVTYYFMVEDGKNPDGTIKYRYEYGRSDKDYIKDGAESRTVEDYINGAVELDSDGNVTLSQHTAEDLKKRSSNADFSQFILHEVIKPAEVRYQSDPATLAAMTNPISNDKKKLVNNEYIYPEEIYIPDGTDIIKAKRIEFVNLNDYDYDVAFYDFSFFENLGKGETLLTKQVRALCGEKEQEIIEHMDVPRGAIVDRFWYDEPEYRQISSYPEPQNAIYAITEETIALTMDIQHRRSPIMAVTKAYTWAKEIDYDIKLVQNSFDPDNYKHVIPHSRFARGLVEIDIKENSKYRTELYGKYFSHPNNDESQPPALKENDVLNMMLNWEEAASKGLETGYVYIRDLYKMTMLLRENKKIHENAYDYMYVPEDIWGFNDGVTQSAFWTNILGSGVNNEDTLSYQELRTMKVKKPTLTWQQVNYDQYEECLKGGTTAAVYGLYPLGSEFVRAYYMQVALASGEFYDGNYTTGHRGADWAGRHKIINIAQVGENLKYGQESVKQSYEAKIYNYELKRRTLQRIMQLGLKEDYRIKVANSYLSGGGDSQAEGYARSAYAMAKGELDAELMKQSVNNPIVATAAGRVLKAGYNYSSGFFVTIDHGAEQDGKVLTMYCHMRRWPEVQVGDEVGPGTLLGYEGTTGNSGGWHVHMYVTHKGDTKDADKWESPAAYFGPIFSPFYDEEKAGEVLKKYESNNILALSSDYFSLIRTVLLAQFNEGSLVEKIETTPFIPTAVFMKISGDETSEYVVFPQADAVLSGDKMILKEISAGRKEPKYWECQVDNIDDVLKSMESQKSEEELKEYKDSVNAILLSGRDIYRVNSKSQISMDVAVGSQGGTIKVKTKPSSPTGGGGAYETTSVKWGNNTPLYPLFQDVSESYDLALLRLQKTYERSDYDEGGIGGEKFSTDINVWSDLFKEDSKAVEERLKNAREMFPLMADISSPYEVPIYDGPVSMEMYEALVNDPDSYGLIGTNSGDLQKLQVAMRAKGFDPEHKMNVDGIYDEETKNTIIRATEAMKKAGFPEGEYFLKEGFEGRLGLVGSKKGDGMIFQADKDLDKSFAWKRYFGTTVVTNWNAYVTYGSWDKMIEASRGAISNAALQTGIHYTFLSGVAEQESSLMNRCEAQEPVYFAPFTGSFNGRYETEAGEAPSTEAVIKYRGEMKTVRRALGLFQFIWTSGLGNAASHGITLPEEVLDALRMPNNNALFAAEKFQRTVLKYKRNKNQLAVIKQIASLPAWKAAAKEAKVDAQTLVMYAMCCFEHAGNTLYEEGTKNFASLAINTFKGCTFSNGVFAKPDGSTSNYFDKVINYMIKNSKYN